MGKKKTGKKPEIKWKPNEGKQTEALQLIEDEVLYGGRRGGGKTEAGIGWLLYPTAHPLYRALVIRRNSKDLVDWIDRADRIYGKFGAVKTGTPAEFKFPSGAVIRTGHLNDAEAYTQYQGHEYQRIVIEELTQIPQESNYEMLLASCRSTIPEIEPMVFCTCNPDGPGFYWVRRRWNIKGSPQEVVRTSHRDPLTGIARTRAFCPAGVDDNPYISLEYKAYLSSLPEGIRQAWLYGSWEDPIIDGAFYTAELDKMRADSRIGRYPCDISRPVHTVWDLGIDDDDAMAITFFQIGQNGKITIIDYYENHNFGMPHYVDILQKKRENSGYIYASHWAPHDGNKRELSSGKTLVQTMYDSYGITFQVVPMVNVSGGIEQVRFMLPSVFINEPNCLQLIQSLRAYRRKRDEKNGIWLAEPVHDYSSHAADTIRYLAVIRNKVSDKPPVQSVYGLTPAQKQYQGHNPIPGQTQGIGRRYY